MDKEKAKNLYSEEDKNRFFNTLAKMPGLGNRIMNPSSYPSKKTETDRFLDSLRYATKADEKKLFSPLSTRTDSSAEELNSSREYVPIRYTRTPGLDEDESYAYLIRYGRDGKNKIYGMETADGRSYTPEGTRKFLEALRSKGGKIELLEQADRYITNSDIGKANGMDASRRGFLEALHMTNEMGRSGMLYNGEMGANRYWNRG